jgi:hypothetical protein
MSRNQGISHHILPTAATMIGVCITVISLIQLIPKNSVSPWVDKFMAVDTIIFLLSAWLSYLTLRNQDNQEKLEVIADRLFLSGLTLMGLVSVLVAFDLLLD